MLPRADDIRQINVSRKRRSKKKEERRERRGRKTKKHKFTPFTTRGLMTFEENEYIA
jgi:hypothetical protein